MRILLFLMSVIAALVGFGLFASAKSAMHETTATAFLIVAAVLFIGAGIIDTLLAIERRLKKATEDPSEPKTEWGGALSMRGSGPGRSLHPQKWTLSSIEETGRRRTKADIDSRSMQARSGRHGGYPMNVNNMSDSSSFAPAVRNQFAHV